MEKTKTAATKTATSKYFGKCKSLEQVKATFITAYLANKDASAEVRNAIITEYRVAYGKYETEVSADEYANKALLALNKVLDDGKAKKSAPKSEGSASATYKVKAGTRTGYNEVYFSEKPTADVRNAIKGMGFYWNGKKECWWGKATKQDIDYAISNARKSA